MRKSRRILWPSLIVLLVLAGIIFGIYLFRDEGGAPRSLAETYQTAAVRRGVLERTVSSSGTLAAVETVTVGTEVSGTIEKVLADFNDKVHKGDILAVLKQDLFAAAVAEAQASIDRAAADLDLAQRELERNRPLFDKGYLSEQEFLPAQINVEKNLAALAAAKASAGRARTNRRNATIRSPIDGTVIQRSIDAGQTVAASLNTPTLFVIARDLARMQIEAAVDETDIGQIREGQDVRFSVQSYPERSFNGRVRQVRMQPETVQNVVTYTVIVEAANSERLLLPGMTATVDFVVERIEDALLVPNAALRFTPQQNDETAPDRGKAARADSADQAASRVYRLTASGLERIAVEIRSSDGQLSALVGESLQEGVRVVTGLAKQATKGKQSFSLFGAMRGRPRK